MGILRSVLWSIAAGETVWETANMRRLLIALLTVAVAFPAGAAAGKGWSTNLAPLNIPSDGIRTIAVVPINFEGQRTRPTTQARLGNMFFNSPDTDEFSESLASYWELSSYGRGTS